MDEKITLIESESPVCPAQAIVEQTASTVYFYLFFPLKDDSEKIRFCWVCNRKPAPQGLDPDFMKGGNAPMMPARFVTHDANGITPDPDALEIVWFEEGESAALLENGRLLAVIPAWSGMKDFHGYCRYAKGTAPFAWEMTQAEQTLTARTDKSRQFWALFEDQDCWGKVQDFHKNIIEDFYGPHTQYYKLDGGYFPPRGLMEGEKDSVVYGFTLGISLFRQPVIELYEENSDDICRIEFGFAAEKACSGIKQEAYQCFMTLAEHMHKDMIFFMHGHTNTWSKLESYGFHAFFLLNTRQLPQIAAPVYGTFRGEPVNLIWAVPVTKTEYDYLLKNGADALLACAKDVSRLNIYDGQPKFKLP